MLAISRMHTWEVVLKSDVCVLVVDDGAFESKRRSGVVF